tara:strand:- start:5204 stop:6190 length:987 start_codon:yes stop_codon:yes gene_type:complete
MSIIKLRSPRFEVLLTPSGAVSAKLELSIGGTLRYTIIKSCTAGSNVEFEISELCRDYLDVAVAADDDHPANTIAISRAVKFYPQANAQGTQVGSTDTVAHTGIDGYGIFTDGVNPTIHSSQVFLLSPNYVGTDSYKVYAPVGYEGSFPYLDTNADVKYNAFDSSETSVTLRSQTITIERLECSKYTPIKVLFLNKWGAMQELWFQTKLVDTLNTTQETYEKNLVTFATNNTATLDIKQHNKKTYNKQGKGKIRLSSGYYPEFTNEWFEELMLSEYVWIRRNNYAQAEKTIPVKLVTSSFTKKTQLNDRLIEYTMDFEEAFDYINNVR